MGKLQDLTGQRYGQLAVIKRVESPDKNSRWLCRCDCGKEIIASAPNLKTHNTESCGCIRSRMVVERNIKARSHGCSKTKLYYIWHGMKYRCYNTNAERFEHYGGRGIKVCDEWLNNFETFQMWAASNGYQDGYSIDRKDVDGDYEPGNCQWLTVSENTYKQHHVDHAVKKAG